MLHVADARGTGLLQVIWSSEEVAFVNPTSSVPEEWERIARALLLDGIELARRAGMARALLILERDDATSALELVRELGFELQARKMLYELDPRHLGRAPSCPGSVRVGREAPSGDVDLVVRRTLPLGWECCAEGADPDAFARAMEGRATGNDPGRPVEWVVARENGSAVGAALPAFLDVDRCMAGSLHVGVLPERRGLGIGAALQWESLRALRQRGASAFVSSTEDDNAPMITVLEKLGYQRIRRQHVFRSRLG